jgi:hypothetical protein
MKNNVIREKLNGLIKPGTTSAMLMIGGFWISQALAQYFINGSLCGLNSRGSGLLFTAFFAVFFYFHFSRPWSRLAAFLGLCSIGITALFSIYVQSTFYDLRFPSIESLIWYCAALSLAGILLDAEKYRIWLNRPEGPAKVNNGPAPGTGDGAQAILW